MTIDDSSKGTHLNLNQLKISDDTVVIQQNYQLAILMMNHLNPTSMGFEQHSKVVEYDWLFVTEYDCPFIAISLAVKSMNSAHSWMNDD